MAIDAHGRGVMQTLSSFACGRYGLVRLLGTGGEKVVYLVHDGVLDRECALALLKPGTITGDAIERFRNEARAIARLGSHPHIVTVFDIGEHEGSPFIVSEHLAGGDLAHALRDAGGRFPVDRAIDVARQLLRALAFVHANGIVHRDLKPGNVWLTPDGIAKLGDFGIAEAAHRVAGESRVAGTPLYMSAEQLRGEPLDGRSDLYALGCTLFELVTGSPPFTGSVSRVMAAHLDEAPPSTSQRVPTAVALDPVIAALLAKSRDDRPASSAEVLAMLDDIQSSGHTTQATAPPPVAGWVAAVQDAMKHRKVPAAIALLRARLAEGPDPEARLLLGRLILLASPDEARQLLELALQEFLDAGLGKRAAIAAARLGIYYNSVVGNRTAARPWIARAWRLVKDEGPCLERGWVAIADVACQTDDPAELRENCDIALEMARRFRDVNLEAKALADAGLALTETGDVAEGTLRLDEALALLTANAVTDPIVATQVLCAFFSSCACTGDLARCESWSRVLRERGLVGGSAPPIITSQCDSVYGGLLCRLGRLNEAEPALERAMEMARTTSYSGRLHSLSSLAELRIHQGRLDEAEELLRGHDDHMEALIPTATLHLARGAYDLAAATARRGVRMLGADRTRAVYLLSVLVEAELRRGDLPAAQRACAALDARVADTKLPGLAAEAACVRARVRFAAGEREEAVGDLERALSACALLELAPLKLKLHVALARLYGEQDPGGAVIEARAAGAIASRLGLSLPKDDLEFLQGLGALPAGMPLAAISGP